MGGLGMRLSGSLGMRLGGSLGMRLGGGLGNELRQKTYNTLTLPHNSRNDLTLYIPLLPYLLS